MCVEKKKTEPILQENMCWPACCGHRVPIAPRAFLVPIWSHTQPQPLWVYIGVRLIRVWAWLTLTKMAVLTPWPLTLTSPTPHLPTAWWGNREACCRSRSDSSSLNHILINAFQLNSMQIQILSNSICLHGKGYSEFPTCEATYRTTNKGMFKAWSSVQVRSKM